MFLRKIVADCSFVERNIAIRDCIEIAKIYNTKVELTVYKDFIKNRVIVTLTKNSNEYKILRYIEKQLI